MRKCVVRDLGRVSYAEAFAIQQELVGQRKQGLIPDHFLFVEHPHTITLGRNGKLENLLAGDAALRAAGIAYHETDRGGDITYHGPGQVVGYPIMDLREWKRDVGAYVRGIEQIQMDMLAEFGIIADRVCKCTGVWVTREDGLAAKIGAIGVHISRWVTSHGFALNVDTDLNYFNYIVPCGLQKPVTSMKQLGVNATMEEVKSSLARQFAQVFECKLEILEAELEKVG